MYLFALQPNRSVSFKKWGTDKLWVSSYICAGTFCIVRWSSVRYEHVMYCDEHVMYCAFVRLRNAVQFSLTVLLFVRLGDQALISSELYE